MIYSTNTRVFTVDPANPDVEAVHIAAQVLRSGGLVAFPTETVYGLGANALDAEAVSRIFSAKERPAFDPVIVHLHSLKQLEIVAADVPELAHRLASLFWPGPLTMVLKRHPNVPPNVSAGMDTVAVRMPDHPVAVALLKAADVPVAAPSANRFARPSATTAQHVLDDLAGRVDVVLDSGPTMIGVESTVIDMTRPTPVVLRPGGVSLEQLGEIIPGIQHKSKLLDSHDSPGASPGMLTRHYSPRARVLLFTGNTDRVIAHMRQTAREYAEQGRAVGIMTTDSEQVLFADIAQTPVQIVSLGANLTEISHNLFTRMRELDSLGVEAILVRGVDRNGLGAAIWDRLLRAAEGHVIHVPD
jgi:L-threonylcarbamoyladenylate synthase